LGSNSSFFLVAAAGLITHNLNPKRAHVTHSDEACPVVTVCEEVSEVSDSAQYFKEN